MNSKKILSLIISFMLLVFVQDVYGQNKALEKISKRKKADSTKTSRSSFNGYPYAFYTPETKLAFGAGGIFIFYTGKDSLLKPSKTSFGVYYTTNKQYRISMMNKFYFFKNKLYFEWPMIYAYNVNKFWGVGNESVKTGTEAYTLKTFSTSFTIQVPPRWFVSDRTGIILDYDNTTIVDKMDNEFLLTDSVSGSNGGELFGIGSDLVWDTRDHIFFPNSGTYQYFKVIVYPGINNNVFALFEADIRHFAAITPDHVFAANVYLSSTTGDAPFYKLPRLGGKKMRGYFEGRYADNFYLTLQLEYRQYFWKRLGFAVFGGVGNVSNSLLEYTLNNPRYNYGAGLRVLFNKKEKVNLRVDLGFGEKGNMGIYFGIEEAF